MSAQYELRHCSVIAVEIAHVGVCMVENTLAIVVNFYAKPLLWHGSVTMPMEGPGAPEAISEVRAWFGKRQGLRFRFLGDKVGDMAWAVVDPDGGVSLHMKRPHE